LTVTGVGLPNRLPGGLDAIGGLSRPGETGGDAELGIPLLGGTDGVASLRRDLGGQLELAELAQHLGAAFAGGGLELLPPEPAIGMEHHIGQIAVGLSADLVVVTRQPQPIVRDVYVAGVQVLATQAAPR
jgi:cytosine/adenosine deaminase-related metal-dependent hydrolase